jgi:hypothetical protein
MTFLSVDLDYFRYGHRPDRFMRKVFNLGLPILVTAQHDQHLEAVNQSGCTALLVVDAHSDLVEPPCDLNEGTWANFVTWKATGNYEWRFPSEDHVVAGYCHAKVSPFEMPCSGWRSVRKKCGLAGIPWDTISHVGICLSSIWLEEAGVGPIVERLGIRSWRKLTYREQKIRCQPFYYSGG